MKSLKNLNRADWIRMAIWAILYISWVIWLGNYWWLLGLVVIFDHHITHKVKWMFWKKEYKEGEDRNILLDWLDALIFAVVVVTFINIFFFQAFKIPSSSMESTLYTGDHLFVSKVAYGPRLPQTPLTIPFTHNVFLGKESYSTAITNEYKRLKGFGHVKAGDIVVFGFPNGDSVLVKAPADDYYALVRETGDRDYVVGRYGPVIARPVDKKDHYVKRCVAIAGDTLSVIDGLVYINSQQQEVFPGIQLSYKVETTGQRINSILLDKLGLNIGELYFDASLPGYPEMPLTAEMLKEINGLQNVVRVTPNLDVYPPTFPDSYLSLFPYKDSFKWTRDNYGPLWIPAKGCTQDLTIENLPLYERIIRDYEGNDLQVAEDGKIFINGEEAHKYTFKQDYFFMMGDNRHNSLDSRYWGFVPEDHIVGRPSLVWYSSDRNKKFPKNIRWGRFFKFL